MVFVDLVRFKLFVELFRPNACLEPGLAGVVLFEYDVPEERVGNEVVLLYALFSLKPLTPERKAQKSASSGSKFPNIDVS